MSKATFVLAVIFSPLLAFSAIGQSSENKASERSKCEAIVRSSQSKLEQIAQDKGRVAVQAQLKQNGCNLQVRITKVDAERTNAPRTVQFAFRFSF